jgi:flagellin-like hook-associated protein FlgL
MGVSIGRQSDLTRMQADLARLTSEMSSGKKSDPARSLGVGASLLYKLHADIQQGESISNATALAGKRLTATQDALDSVGKLMDQMSPEILKVDALKGNGYAIIASNAREVMGSMMDLLNTSWDGQNLFGGTDSASSPLEGADALLSWTQNKISVAVPVGSAPLGAGAVEDAAGAPAGLLKMLNDMFSNTARDSKGADLTSESFYGVVYRSTSRTELPAGGVVDENGAPVAEETGNASLVRIGAGETLSYNVRADNPAFRDAFQSLAILSMLDTPDAQISAEAKQVMLDRAGALMRGAREQLTVSAGILGSKQERLARVAEIQERTVTAATAQINDLESVDYYTISDRISTLQIQLQATYSITAQLSKLSLVNYL